MFGGERADCDPGGTGGQRYSVRHDRQLLHNALEKALQALGYGNPKENSGFLLKTKCALFMRMRRERLIRPTNRANSIYCGKM